MNLRAWLRRPDPASVVVILAIVAVFAAILLSPPVPETAYPPPTTIAYGQPDTMHDTLEGRVYTTEQVLEEQHKWIVELQDRIEELERRHR